jgi:hypothetical protein
MMDFAESLETREESGEEARRVAAVGEGEAYEVDDSVLSLSSVSQRVWRCAASGGCRNCTYLNT